MCCRTRLLVPLLLVSICDCSRRGTPRDGLPTKQVRQTSALPSPPSVASVVTSDGRGSATAARHPAGDTASVRMFVQSFYDWYVPIALQHNEAPAWYRVLQSRDTVLSTELRSGLRADSTRQAAMSGEVTELNFDPFLASQDPCAKYEVANIQSDTSGYRVTVHPACGSGYQQPDVRVEVVRSEGMWQFADFYYDGIDLKSVLCESAREGAAPGSVTRDLQCGPP